MSAHDATFIGFLIFAVPALALAALTLWKIASGDLKIVVSGRRLRVGYFRRDHEKAPPALAEWALTLLVSKQKIEGLLGDLEERFHRNCASRGVRRAKWLYWAETFRSIAPLLWSTAQKIGVVAVVAAAARRFLG